MDFSRPLSVVAPTLDGDVLGVLAGADDEFTGRRIHQVLGRGSEAGVRKAADRLVGQGIVSRRQAGQAKLYSLNRDHLAAPYVVGLRSLKAQLVERLERAVAEWEAPPEALFLFGSVARGEATAESDLDLFVLRPTVIKGGTEVWEEQLSKLERDATVWTGNEARVVEYRHLDLKDLEVRRIAREALMEGIAIAGTRARLSALMRKYEP
ncbi:MAG TPA: nucleotidyltransferase domain-containing protein [Solirubrobacterales bacterium]|nr:nucleotidyltransferase domain-containing protein [Solirubrobacterales bacterium]